jgi:hypothetical protein
VDETRVRELDAGHGGGTPIHLSIFFQLGWP